jgi:hypothetical protein
LNKQGATVKEADKLGGRQAKRGSNSIAEAQQVRHTLARMVSKDEAEGSEQKRQEDK